MEVGEKHVIFSSLYKHMMMMMIMMIQMMIKMIVTNHRLSSSMMMVIDDDICCVGAVGESGEPAWNIAYECRNKVRSGCMTFQLHAIVGNQSIR